MNQAQRRRADAERVPVQSHSIQHSHSSLQEIVQVHASVGDRFLAYLPADRLAPQNADGRLASVRTNSDSYSVKLAFKRCCERLMAATSA